MSLDSETSSRPLSPESMNWPELVCLLASRCFCTPTARMAASLWKRSSGVISAKSCIGRVTLLWSVHAGWRWAGRQPTCPGGYLCRSQEHLSAKARIFQRKSAQHQLPHGLWQCHTSCDAKSPPRDNNPAVRLASVFFLQFRDGAQHSIFTRCKFRCGRLPSAGASHEERTSGQTWIL